MNYEDEILAVGYDCKLVKYTYDDAVTLEYIEHSSDGWYSNSETTIDIDKEKAIEIIKFLKQHLNIYI